MNRIEIMRITLTILLATSLTIIGTYAHSITNVQPIEKIMNILKITSYKNCTIMNIANTLPTELIVNISCTSPIENKYLIENNCTLVKGTRYMYKCVWNFAPGYTVKASSARYGGYRIYVVETHIRTIGTITSHPAISATSVISCSQSSPRCIVMVYDLTNVRNILIIVPDKVRFLFCEGLDLYKKYDLGSYEVYVFHVSSNTKLMYSSRGVFFSSCAVLTEDEVYHNMFIGNISLGVAAGLAAGLAVFMIVTYITLRRH